MNKRKIDSRLLMTARTLSTQEKQNCIVFLNEKLPKEFFAKQGVKILDEYLFINAVHCLAEIKQIFLLSDCRQISYISSLSNAKSQMLISKKVLRVPKTQLTGNGVGIAFIDTGLAPHGDFLIGKNRIEFFKDFVANKNEAYDDNGHGTFVCGVACGSGALSKFKFSGIAPKSSIVALKALDGKGESGANKILDAMEWVFENRKKMGINVVCMSFGSEPLGLNDPIMLGAEALWREGVVVVAAAGNSGPEFETIKSPGTSPKIITVGGIDDNRFDNKSFNPNFYEMAEFSSRGPALRKIKPDLVAPSVDVNSCGTKDFYTTLSGTSVATPMIAGLCALMLEKNPNLTPNQIKKNLLLSCHSLGFNANFEGYGLPNAEKLLH